MKPNILMITVDDMNYDSVGFLGNHNITPNIDKLASEGRYFKHAHVSVAVCQPSRQCIMTGKYPHNNGSHGFTPISNKVQTLQEVLSEMGYLNGIVGKLDHLAPITKYCWDYIKDLFYKKHLWGRIPEDYYRYTKDFFNQVKEDDSPFFLMVNSHDPHRPFAGSQQELDMFGVATKASKVYTEEDVTVPGFLPDIPEVRKEVAQYFTSVHRADESVGMILQALEDAGLSENTIVMFLSDNGMAFPFAKTNCYLNSTKTPFIIKWPKVIREQSVDTDNCIAGVDIMPTILDMLEVEYDTEELDGKSFLNVLTGKEDDLSRDKIFTLFNANHAKMDFEMRCVQTKEYGYIYNEWSDGERQFKNESMSGLTFDAMAHASENNQEINERVNMFLYREPEEFYDFDKDPNGLVNLIHDENYQDVINVHKKYLLEDMKRSKDPLTEKFINTVY